MSFYISKFYGRNFSIEKLRELTEIGKEGVNIWGISDAAEKIGFRTLSMQIESDQLAEIAFPAVLHWDQNHFVVLYKIKNKKYYISDPARGLFVCSKLKFLSHWASSASQGANNDGNLPVCK